MNDIYNMFSVNKKKILITGAANGNGRVIAEALGLAGSELYLIDVDSDSLTIVADKIEKQTNTKVKRFAIDLSDSNKIDNFLYQHNDFDVVINNAGITRGNHLFDYSDEDWDMTYKVNLYAPYKIIQKISKKMALKKSGSIINITSLAAELGFPGNPAYVAFKGALKQLTKAVACDLSGSGVRVNSVGPGYMKTDMTKKSWNDEQLRFERTNRTILNRWGESSDLVGVIIFLSSEASLYVTGQEFYIDGGWLAKGL
jgi:NAD(P)-dependent dehydrogenase (short-subunit alcohol dehydrogenase family)